jgi:hypothetical protein
MPTSSRQDGGRRGPDPGGDDIVCICREMLDKANDFCQKITYEPVSIAMSKRSDLRSRLEKSPV